MHRDLKPENAIFYHNRVIIIDFGFAKFFKHGDSVEGGCGTPNYVGKNKNYYK